MSQFIQKQTSGGGNMEIGNPVIGGTPDRFLQIDSAGNLADTSNAIFAADQVFLQADPDSTNGTGLFQIGELDLGTLGTFPGVGASHTYDNGGSTYTQSLVMAEADDFGGVPIAQLALTNTTSGDAAYFRVGDFGSLATQIEVDVAGQITGIGIFDGVIGFKIQEDDVFQIPTNTPSANVGDVLTLVDETTGETEWAAGGGVSLGTNMIGYGGSMGQLTGSGTFIYDPTIDQFVMTSTQSGHSQSGLSTLIVTNPSNSRNLIDFRGGRKTFAGTIYSDSIRLITADGVATTTGDISLKTGDSETVSGSIYLEAGTGGNDNTGIILLNAGNVASGLLNASAGDSGNGVIIRGGAGTGTGLGGNIVFEVAPAGTSGTTPNAYVTPLAIKGSGIIGTSGMPAYDDDTAAGVGGLAAGEMYQTTGSGAAPLNVAGILMIKQ